MALTDKEIAFWNSFKEMLKREGIDEKHPYRLAEVITIENFLNKKDGTVDENVLKLGMIESGEDSPFANEFPGYASSEKEACSVIRNPAYMNDVEEAMKAFVQEDVEIGKKWIKDNIKNPFDPEHEPSERHIKALYKAFTEGRLGLQHIAIKNNEKNEVAHDIAFCYAAEDGSIQLTRFNKELDKTLPFSLRRVCTVGNLVNEARNAAFVEKTDEPEMVKYLNNKYGENIAEDIKILSDPKPKKPSFFTKVLSVFGNKKSRAQVDTYNRYEKAEKKLNNVINKIAKDAYPELKNPAETIKHLDTGIVVTDNANAAFTVHNLAVADYARRTNEDNEKKLQELTNGRSENDKEMMKYILESRQDGSLPKNIRDFLSDIPKIYDTMTYIEEHYTSNDGQLKEVFNTNESKKSQTEVAKFAVAKLIVDDLKAGNLNTNMIKMINEGRGDQLVEAFRVTYKPLFSDAAGMKNLVNKTTTEIREKYEGFTDKSFAILTDEKLINLNKHEIERQIADDAKRKAKEDIELENKLRVERIKTLEDSNVKSYSYYDMKELVGLYAKEYKANPSVENFSKWKVADSVSGRMTPDKSEHNVDRKTIDSSIKQCKEQVNQLKEFKSGLEAGRYNTTEKAEASFLNAINKATENKEQLKNNNNSNQKNNNLTTNVEEQMRMK